MAGTPMNPENFNLPLSFVVSVVTSIIPLVGFYFLTNWRLKRLEKSEESLNQASQQLRDKLTEVTIIMNYIKERLA